MTIFIGDQADNACLNDIVRSLIPLPSSSMMVPHIAGQQVASFEASFPKLICGGTYIVEELILRSGPIIALR